MSIAGVTQKGVGTAVSSVKKEEAEKKDEKVIALSPSQQTALLKALTPHVQIQKLLLVALAASHLFRFFGYERISSLLDAACVVGELQNLTEWKITSVEKSKEVAVQKAMTRLGRYAGLWWIGTLLLSPFSPRISSISNVAFEAFRLSQVRKMPTSGWHRFAYTFLLIRGLFGKSASLISSFASAPNVIPDCLTPNCPAIPLDSVPEETLKRAYFAFTEESMSLLRSKWLEVQELLRFHKGDPRKKFLVVSANYDYNGAFHPVLSILAGRKPTDTFLMLENKYDVRYQRIETSDDLCKAVESGAQTGTLAGVLIQSHGQKEAIRFSNNADPGSLGYLFAKSPLSCLSAIEEGGRILLRSCQTDNGLWSIAKEIAERTNRTVVATARDSNPSTRIFFEKGGSPMLFLEDKDRPGVNAFHLVKPLSKGAKVCKNHEECQQFDKDLKSVRNFEPDRSLVDRLLDGVLFFLGI